MRNLEKKYISPIEFEIIYGVSEEEQEAWRDQRLIPFTWLLPFCIRYDLNEIEARIQKNKVDVDERTVDLNGDFEHIEGGYLF